MALTRNWVYKPKKGQKKGRGSRDAAAILDILIEDWEEFQSGLNNLDPEDIDKIKVHFNTFIEGEDELGDMLFGSDDDFQCKFNLLSDPVQAQYTNEMLSKILDLD